MKPFTPDEEAAALAIAQSGADGVLEWMRAEDLIGPGFVPQVVGFDLSPDGRIVANIKWAKAAPPDRSGLN